MPHSMYSPINRQCAETAFETTSKQLFEITKIKSCIYISIIENHSTCGVMVSTLSLCLHSQVHSGSGQEKSRAWCRVFVLGLFIRTKKANLLARMPCMIRKSLPKTWMMQERRALCLVPCAPRSVVSLEVRPPLYGKWSHGSVSCTRWWQNS